MCPFDPRASGVSGSSPRLCGHHDAFRLQPHRCHCSGPCGPTATMGVARGPARQPQERGSSPRIWRRRGRRWCPHDRTRCGAAATLAAAPADAAVAAHRDHRFCYGHRRRAAVVTNTAAAVVPRHYCHGHRRRAAAATSVAEAAIGCGGSAPAAAAAAPAQAAIVAHCGRRVLHGHRVRAAQVTNPAAAVFARRCSNGHRWRVASATATVREPLRPSLRRPPLFPTAAVAGDTAATAT